MPEPIRDGACAGRRWLERHAGLVALIIALTLSFAGIFQHELWAPDEPREAEIGREMALNGSALPTLDGQRGSGSRVHAKSRCIAGPRE